MYRSFTDRVLGGVCGGIGRSPVLTPWVLRILFIVFSIVSLGAGVLLYAALWWVIPQESLVVQQRRANPFVSLLAIALVVIIVAAWIGQQTGQLTTDDGTSLYWPVLLTTVSAVYLLRQIWRTA
jgi:phage shock protein PspC (stress-responsive transcriptional regulator)